MNQDEEFTIKITGSVKNVGETFIELDWFGGSILKVAKERMVGDWWRLKEGSWFSATIHRRLSGEVMLAKYTGTIDPPKYMSEKEIEESYLRIKPAKLAPID